MGSTVTTGDERKDGIDWENRRRKTNGARVALVWGIGSTNTAHAHGNVAAAGTQGVAQCDVMDQNQSTALGRTAI